MLRMTSLMLMMKKTTFAVEKLKTAELMKMIAVVVDCEILDFDLQMWLMQNYSEFRYLEQLLCIYFLDLHLHFPVPRLS